jgi:hypothetical protein
VSLELPWLRAAQRRARFEMLLEPGGEWLAWNRRESAGEMLSGWLMFQWFKLGDLSETEPRF